MCDTFGERASFYRIGEHVCENGEMSTTARTYSLVRTAQLQLQYYPPFFFSGVIRETFPIEESVSSEILQTNAHIQKTVLQIMIQKLLSRTIYLIFLLFFTNSTEKICKTIKKKKKNPVTIDLIRIIKI